MSVVEWASIFMNDNMKRLVLLPIFLIAALGAGTGLVHSQNLLEIKQAKGIFVSAQATPSPVPTPTPIPEDLVLEPKILNIPKIGVSANLEVVGQDAQGRMDVPKLPENAAWYNLGYKIGQKGSAVIAGHFDTSVGAPAVFYNLNKLEIGDEITVIDLSGKQMKFKVFRKETYDFDKIPLMEVFASSDRIGLNLITCEGSFDAASKNYSKRMVIYTEKVTP